MSEPQRKRGSSRAFNCFVVGLFVGYWLAALGEGTLMSTGTLIGATAGGILGFLIGLAFTEF